MAGHMAELLSAAGHRLTAPRLAVLRVLEGDGSHMSAEEVLRRGRAICPHLSRATVYRTLELLTGLGALRTVRLDGRATSVVCVTGGHQHLLCLGCGRAIHFTDGALAEVREAVSLRTGFEVKSHLLEVYGLCERCRAKQADSASCSQQAD